MDEIEQRLRESTDTCIKSYEAWRGNQKNEEARENLAEAIHELRKVASRLEIEIAVSEREQMGGRPLPIPPHRSSRKMQSGEEGGFADDDIGNTVDEAEDNAGNNGQPQRRQNNNMRRPNNNMHRNRRPGGGGGGRPNQGHE